MTHPTSPKVICATGQWSEKLEMLCKWKQKHDAYLSKESAATLPFHIEASTVSTVFVGLEWRIESNSVCILLSVCLYFRSHIGYSPSTVEKKNLLKNDPPILVTDARRENVSYKRV